jgi:hypothetical protein
MAIGVLLLPVALVVTAFGPWSESRVAAEAIAAEATRTAVLELSQEAGLERILADSRGLNIEPSLVRAGWCGAEATTLGSPAGACAFVRGSVVDLTIELWTPLVSTPWGAVGGLWVTAQHAEPIDLYRSLAP